MDKRRQRQLLLIVAQLYGEFWGHIFKVGNTEKLKTFCRETLSCSWIHKDYYVLCMGEKPPCSASSGISRSNLGLARPTGWTSVASVFIFPFLPGRLSPGRQLASLQPFVFALFCLSVTPLGCWERIPLILVIGLDLQCCDSFPDLCAGTVTKALE